jgi:hypothetical protein
MDTVEKIIIAHYPPGYDKRIVTQIVKVTREEFENEDEEFESFVDYAAYTIEEARAEHEQHGAQTIAIEPDLAGQLAQQLIKY